MTKPESLEEQLKRLEEIVGKLEVSELTLEEAILLFEEGAALVKSAQKKLAQSEIKVQKIVKDLEDAPELVDFDVEE